MARWRLKAQEKENNLENKVIQEVDGTEARLKVLDRKRDVPSLKWRDGVRLGRNADRFVKEGVSSWGSLLEKHKFIHEGDEIICYSLYSAVEWKADRQSKTVKICNSGLGAV